MTCWPRPTPSEQLIFLQQIQRLFEDASFSATYKYALLIALAELAVEKGADDGDPLDLGIGLIAEKIAELYWPQTALYSSGSALACPGILAQNKGSQAEVITALLKLRQAGVNTIAQAKQNPTWGRTRQVLAENVRRMPVKYLQNVGGITLPFLYDYPPPQGLIRLKPGVPYCLRLFQGLIMQLARNGWLSHVRQNGLNAPIIGEATDLEAFMFGTPRQNLAVASGILLTVQDHQCFYCEGRIAGPGEVDHFIPWSKYPRDLAHNFVLAHPQCNGRKSDLLAAKPHLSRWLERNHRHGLAIAERFGEAGFLVDAKCSTTVAQWAYQQALEIHGWAWLGEKRMEPVTVDYLETFPATA